MCGTHYCAREDRFMDCESKTMYRKMPTHWSVPLRLYEVYILRIHVCNSALVICDAKLKCCCFNCAILSLQFRQNACLVFLLGFFFFFPFCFIFVCPSVSVLNCPRTVIPACMCVRVCVWVCECVFPHTETQSN